MRLEITFPLNAVTAARAATLCGDFWGDRVGEQKLYGVPVTPTSLRRKLQNKWALLLEGPGVRAHLASVKNRNLAFLEVDGIDPGSESALVQQANTIADVISARLFDPVYEHWQNAEDPLEYEAAGRSMADLLLISNGLPPPLQQMIVDTSRNPGRRLLADGFVEAIGHRMWLGQEFFRRVPAVNREVIFHAPSLEVSEGPSGVLEIIAGDEPFSDQTSTQRQNRLRCLIFSTPPVEPDSLAPTP